MKAMRGIRSGWHVIWLLYLIAAFAPAASAEVIHQTVTYPSDAIASWPSIDFDGDGTPELSFDFYALGHESGGAFFLTAQGSTNVELLLQGWGVLPLNWGDSISSSNSMGQWSGTGFGSTVWTRSFYTGGPIIVFTPGEVISTNTPPQSPPGQGVGMPGYGNFIGVRFLLDGDWHYGWVRFGALDGSSFFAWPSVLDYAYETSPDTAISAGAGIDSDNDGLWDLSDQCPGTPAGEAVDANGCSIEQIVPCDGPWKNHGDYMNYVQSVASQFFREGLISGSERRAIVKQAAASNCGKHR